MALRLRTTVTFAAIGVLLAVLALIFRDSIGIVVFLALGLVVVALLMRVAAHRESLSRLSRTCRAPSDVFWGIG